ncbi:hypothetical protein ACFQQB_63460 [Nonomuraea rubra]|uniref:hypothetical protein n=1 Tax=Nonomuraea rubra TaxID=46180 RepID=UPI0036194B86
MSESVELLSRILGRDRIQQEEQPAQQLASAFGGLPLALRVLSGRLVSEPRPLATFLARLDRRRAAGQLLSELTFGDLSVAASLALSREHLPLPTQTAFDLLGLHPADEWSDWSVAALCECSLLDAQRLLERLTGAQLVKTRTVAGTDEPRYYLHDLVREFARNQAVLNMPEESREQAVRRIASAYLAMTDLADEAIHPGGVRHQGRTQAPRYPWTRTSPAAPSPIPSAGAAWSAIRSPPSWPRAIASARGRCAGSCRTRPASRWRTSGAGTPGSAARNSRSTPSGTWTPTRPARRSSGTSARSTGRSGNEIARSPGWRSRYGCSTRSATSTA